MDMVPDTLVLSLSKDEGAPGLQRGSALSLDTIIRGGTVCSGDPVAPIEADIGLADGRIAAIGRIEASAPAEIAARGLLVAPGFIDIHSHSDYTLLVDPRARSAVHQGVTLEVLGNCGFGCAPIGDPALAPGSIYGWDGSVPLDWRGVGGYLDRLEERRPAVNVMTLVPNGQLRRATVGLADRPADADELAAMRRLLAQGLEEGAIGYSTGLEYPAEAGAPESEVAALAAVTQAAGGLYATHTRARDAAALPAIDEAIRTARATGARLQVSHLFPRATADGMIGRAVERIERAAADGVDIHFDMHTRPFGTTMLNTLVPPWVAAEGAERRAALLRDPDARARMRAHRSIVASLGDWSRVVLLDLPPWPHYSRRSVAEIAAERGQDPQDAALELLAAEPAGGPPFMVILLCYSADQQAEMFAHPGCVPASDATTLAPDGPLAGAAFHGAYSWAAWFWRFTVRERRLLSAAEAVHRMTGLPADILGLPDRGRLRVGAAADIVVLDPERFGERGTVFAPSQLAEGVRHLFVNGVATLRDGAPTGARGGRVLRGLRPARGGAIAS
jgi:N-acyl-D-aspartate/D-glutamate deacylase